MLQTSKFHQQCINVTRVFLSEVDYREQNQNPHQGVCHFRSKQCWQVAKKFTWAGVVQAVDFFSLSEEGKMLNRSILLDLRFNAIFSSFLKFLNLLLIKHKPILKSSCHF